MSWSDPARRFEPAEDVQLRAELRDLLGLAPAAAPRAAAPAAELAALADDLRREAQRRRRTERKRPTWGLLAAAALPVLAALAGLGTWGVQQKQRADSLALQADRQQKELVQMAATHAAELAQVRQGQAAPAEAPLQLASAKKPARKSEPYLVIPVEKSSRPAMDDLQRVKQAPNK